MTEYAQRQRQTRTTEDETDATEAVDLTDAQLDEDVNCCLADIDAALDDNDAESVVLADKREREQSAAERDFYANYSKRNGRAWEQKYAHLNAYLYECCGVLTPQFRDD